MIDLNKYYQYKICLLHDINIFAILYKCILRGINLPFIIVNKAKYIY